MTLANSSYRDDALDLPLATLYRMDHENEWRGAPVEGGSWFQRFVESSPDLVVFATPDGRIRYVSPAVERLLGYPPAEFVRLAPDLVRLVEEILHPENPGLAAKKLAEGARGPAGPRTPVFPVRARHKDGSWRFFEGHVNNLVDDGEVSGLVFVSRDVTERVWAEEEARKLQGRLEALVEERAVSLGAALSKLKANERVLKASEERFRLTFEAVAVGMAHVAPDGGFIRVNDKLCQIVGYPREELLGMSYLDLTLPGDTAAGEERLRRLLDGRTGPYSVEGRFVRKDGYRVWVSLCVSLVRAAFGEPDYIICAAENVTERKISELVPDPLTSQELEVLRLMAAGLTNPQVALRLSYSLGGVKHQVQRVIAKLGAKNRGDAVARAIGSGLICPPGE